MAKQLRFKSPSPFTMIRNYMTEAIQILETVRDFVFPDRHEYLHPYTVLKALLTHAPSETAKQDIAKNIIEITAEGDIVAGLTDLTDYWWAKFLVPLGTQGGKSQLPSDHPSRPEEFRQRLIAGRLSPCEKALHRCGFRCPVTGYFDRLAPNKPDGIVGYALDAAHIIPHYLSHVKIENECEQKNKTWQALRQFAGPEISDEFEDQNIDALKNIIILEKNAHVEFGQFNLWFTPDESNPNRYRINLVIDGKRSNGIYIAIAPGAVASGDYVEFMNLVPEYPSISRTLLGVHAAIAEVLHMIGAGEAIDNILWEWERILYLSEDGADAGLLADRLSLIAAS